MTNKPEMNEVATSDKDTTYSAFMGLMQSQDQGVSKLGVEQAFKQYDELEEDAMVSNLMQKRKMAVISREWGIATSSDSAQDLEIASFVEKTLKEVGFDAFCKDALEAIFKGFSVTEIMWATKDNRIVIDSLLSRNPARFAFAADKTLRMKTTSDPMSGEAVPEHKFVVYSYGGKYGNPYGKGLASKLYWPVFFKKNGIRFWLTFAEKFGNPTLVGKYPRGASSEEKSTLMQGLRSFSSDTAVVVPEGMTVEMVEAMRTGSVDTYNQLVALMDKQMSICVLGETLTTDIGEVGSKAASETHNDVRLELVKADSDLLCEVINKQLIEPLVMYNYPNAIPPKVWRNVEEQEDMDKRADRDKKLYEMGYAPTEEYVSEYYGKGYQKIEAEPKVNASKTSEFAEASPDAEDELTEQLSNVASASLDDMIYTIKKRTNTVNSLEELKESLPNMFSEIDDAALAEIMSAGMLVSDLQGRGDVLDEGES